MTINNNPLKQYFRRPAVYIRLPSEGKNYPPGVIDMPENKELPVFPMTAIDEITTKTPDALFNGTAVFELIKSCIPAIKDPWAILSSDLDTILIGMKAASSGNNMDVESQCPKCSDTSTYTINLVSILSQLKSPDYNKTLDLDELKIKFKPLTYKQMNQAGIGQFEAQKLFASMQNATTDEEKANLNNQALKMVTELTMDILSKTIEYIETPGLRVDNIEFILDFLKNCDKNTYTAIRDYHSTLKEMSALKPMHIKCANCENQYEQPFTLNASDFFG